MARSEAQKRADRNYKAKIKGEKFHFCIEMGTSEANTLKILAEKAGTSPHAVMLTAARDFIAAHSLPSGGDGQTDSGTAD